MLTDDFRNALQETIQSSLPFGRSENLKPRPGRIDFAIARCINDANFKEGRFQNISCNDGGVH